MRQSDLRQCCRRLSLPQRMASETSWGQRAEDSIAFLFYRERGSRDILIFIFSLRTTKGASARLDITTLSVPVSKVHCKTHVLFFLNTWLVLSCCQLNLTVAKSESIFAFRCCWNPLTVFLLLQKKEVEISFICVLRLILDTNNLVCLLCPQGSETVTTPDPRQTSLAEIQSEALTPSRLFVCCGVVSGVCTLFNHLSSRSLSPLLLAILIYSYYATQQKYFYFPTSTCVCSQEQLPLSILSAC